MKSKPGYCRCGCGQKTSIAKVTNSKRGHVAGQPVPYVSAGHAMARKAGPDYEVDPETDCWLWLKNTRMGYGRIWEDGRLQSAHVWYWEQENGPKPKGMDLDHLCHNQDESCPGGPACRHRRCVNPDHLEPVARAGNVRRGRVAKLTPKQAAEIRAQPWMALNELAAKYGVVAGTITAIRTGRIWGEVSPAEGFATSATYERGLGAPVERRRAPLTEEEVAEIRATPRHYGTGRALARKFGVADSTISAVRNGQNWTAD